MDQKNIMAVFNGRWIFNNFGKFSTNEKKSFFLYIKHELLRKAIILIIVLMFVFIKRIGKFPWWGWADKPNEFEAMFGPRAFRQDPNNKLASFLHSYENFLEIIYVLALIILLWWVSENFKVVRISESLEIKKLDFKEIYYYSFLDAGSNKAVNQQDAFFEVAQVLLFICVFIFFYLANNKLRHKWMHKKILINFSTYKEEQNNILFNYKCVYYTCYNKK